MAETKNTQTEGLVGPKNDLIEFRETRKYEDHKTTIRNICIFGSPQFKIVTCSLDKTSRILDYSDPTKLTCLKIISDSTQKYCDVIKLNPDVFLLTGFDSYIRGYSIQSPYKKLFEMRDPQLLPIFRLLRLTDDLFVSHCDSGEVRLYSFSQQRIVKSLERQKIEFYKIIRVSKVHPFCFYLNTDEDILAKDETQIFDPNSNNNNENNVMFYSRMIKLLDYSDDDEKKNDNNKNEVRNYFAKHYDAIYSMSVVPLEESEQSELLIVGGNGWAIYVYGSYKEKEVMAGGGPLLQRINHFESLYAGRSINSNYYLVGNGIGEMFLYSMDLSVVPSSFSSLKNNNINSLEKKKKEEGEGGGSCMFEILKLVKKQVGMHKDNIREFKLISKKRTIVSQSKNNFDFVEENDENSFGGDDEIALEMVSCAGEKDGNVRVFQIVFKNGAEVYQKLFNRVERQEREDLLERLGYIRFETEKWMEEYHEEEEKKRSVVQIRLLNLSIQNVLKVFFC